MKAYKYNSRMILLSSLVLLLLTGNTIFAQHENKFDKFTKHAIGNLTNAIKSDNEGLKKSAITFAGEYRINNVTELLISELNKSDNPEIRCMAAKALFKIGNQKGIDELLANSHMNENLKVRKVCGILYQLYQLDVRDLFAKNN